MIRLVQDALAQVLKSWRMVGILWCLNLGVTLLGFASVFAAMQKALSKSPIAAEMTSLLEGPLFIDLGFVLQRTLEKAGPNLMIALVLGGLLQGVVIGGIYGRLNAMARGGDGERLLSGFMGDCGRYLVRSYLLLVVGLVVSGLAFVPVALVRAWAKRHAADSVMETSVLWIQLMVGVLIVGWFLVTRVVVELARAQLFVPGGPGVLRAMVGGIQVFLRHPGRALGVYTVTILLVSGAAALVMGARVLMPSASTPWIVVGALVGQVAIVLKVSSNIACARAAQQLVELSRVDNA